MALKFRDLFKPGSADRADPAAASPTDPYTRALQLQQQGQLEQAISLFDEAIASEPANAEAHYKRANSLNALGRLEAALAGYDQAVALNANHAYALCNRGTVLERLGRWPEALASYDRALSIAPDPLAFYNRGGALRQLQQPEAAVASYDQALALQPHYLEAWVNRAHTLQSLARFDEALASFQRALELKADFADVLLARAKLLVARQRYDEGLAAFDHILSLLPDSAESHRGRAAVLMQLNRIDEAIASYDRAVALQPGQKYLLGMRQYAKMQVCDWSGLTEELARLAAGLEAREAVMVPLTALALFDSPALHALAAEIHVREECPQQESLAAAPIWPPGRRIRIGYFSSDFRVHPVSLLTAELFDLHDRERFEVTAFAFGPPSRDAVRARLKRAFERFVEVDRNSDVEVAQLSRRLHIDIAIDLNGHTQHARTRIFAMRAAPVQVNYLGYAGTMGASYMDYLVADRVLVPAGAESHFSEKIIYLPHSYLPNDSRRTITGREFTRAEQGLPESGFVFCCFNRAFKLMPATVDCWMRILRRAPGSVLWLSRADETVIHRLRHHARRRDVDGARILFAPPMESPADHLARQRLAGLFLDTLPFNAHTTATDALWAGVPVLTCLGQAMPGRVAASLLTTVGLPELIATTMADYEELAVRLAGDAAELALLRHKLARQRLETPLYDMSRYTRSLEEAYRQIYERSQAGLPTEHIALAR